MKNYIKEKNKKKTNFSIKGIDIQILNHTPSDASIMDAVEKIFEIFPSSFFSGLESIKIGNFSYLKKRKIKALYSKKTIYLSNDQDDTNDMLDDLVHELAHFLEEEKFKSLIYGDKEVEKEFIQKRKILFQRLKDKNYKVNKKDFLNTEFDYEFDMYLYETIGYKTLSAISSDIFYKPYSITSVREYFADSFEAFFYKKDVEKIKSISPALYKKNYDIMMLAEK